jgi:hypothetical protein
MLKPGERVWTLVKRSRRFNYELRFQGESPAIVRGFNRVDRALDQAINAQTDPLSTS